MIKAAFSFAAATCAVLVQLPATAWADAALGADARACDGPLIPPSWARGSNVVFNAINEDGESPGQRLEKISAILKKHPDDSFALAESADLELSAGHIAEASAHYRRAIELVSSYPRAVFELQRGLASALYYEHRDAEFVDLSRELREKACGPPTDIELTHLAEVLKSDPGQIAEAEKIIAPVLEGKWPPAMALLVGIDIACNRFEYRVCAKRLVAAAMQPFPLDDESRTALTNLASKLQAQADAHDLLQSARAAGTFGADWTIPKFSFDALAPIKVLAPRYPRDAASHGTTGYVDLRLRIDETGSVVEALVTGANPPGVFEAAALSAAKRSKFKPKRINGVAVPSTGMRRYDFQLGD